MLNSKQVINMAFLLHFAQNLHVAGEITKKVQHFEIFGIFSPKHFEIFGKTTLKCPTF